MSYTTTALPASGIAIIAGNLKARFKTWQTRRRAIAALHALDDRMLADIGVDRGAIPEAVEHALAGTAANDNRRKIAA
jgi:uncharacterized protein YjiS (DUF1127 family)